MQNVCRYLYKNDKYSLGASPVICLNFYVEKQGLRKKE